MSKGKEERAGPDSSENNTAVSESVANPLLRQASADASLSVPTSPLVGEDERDELDHLVGLIDRIAPPGRAGNEVRSETASHVARAVGAESSRRADRANREGKDKTHVRATQTSWIVAMTLVLVGVLLFLSVAWSLVYRKPEWQLVPIMSFASGLIALGLAALDRLARR